MKSLSLPALRALVFVLFATVLAACGTRSGLLDPPAPDVADAATCQGPALLCVAPDADPCGPPRRVASACDGASLTWQCPAGTRPLVRAPAESGVCRPFYDPGGPVRALGGSLVRVPTEDGRCLWIAEEVTLASGQGLRNVGFEVDPAAPFGSCPRQVAFADGVARTMVAVEGDDRALSVQITGGYRQGGVTRVTYRLFRNDPSAGFGVRLLGSGLGRWDPGSRRVIVPGAGALRFATEIDLGDASLVLGDTAYLWGCPGPPTFLTERCVVGRLGSDDRLALWTAGGWRDSTRGGDAATVFEAGPWVSSVVRQPGTTRLVHVFAVGFGSDLQSRTAPEPQGPWTGAVSRARCDLPGDDRNAFCAGPVVHLELADPTRPSELAVTYGLGTTASDGGARVAANPGAYWPRLQWVQVP